MTIRPINTTTVPPPLDNLDTNLQGPNDGRKRCSVSCTVWIACPPQDVCRLLSDRVRYVAWKSRFNTAPNVYRSMTRRGRSKLTVMTSGLQRSTVRFAIERVGAPVLHVDHGVIDEDLWPRLETWSTYRLEPKNNGTRLQCTFQYTLPLGILGRIADRLIIRSRLEAEMRKSHERLKQMIEETAPMRR